MKLPSRIILIAAAALSLPANAQFNSPQAKGYSARAAAMLAEKNFQGCVDQCEMALKLGAPDREGVMWMNAVASIRGGFADARAKLTAFVNTFPASPRREHARMLLASLTFFDGNYSAALPQLLAVSASSLEPDAAEDLKYRIAYCYQMLGDYGKSTELFEQLGSSPRYAVASLFYRGYAAWAQGDYPLAEDLLTRAYAAPQAADSPGRMAPYYLAEIAYSRKDYSRVEKLLQPLMADTSTASAAPADLRDEATRLYGESLYALGKEKEGVRLLKQYAENHSADIPVSTLYVLGVDSYRHGRYAEAVELLSSPGFPNDAMGQNASLFLGLSQLNEGNTSAATLAFRKAIDMDFDAEATETAFYNYAVARTQGGREPFGNSTAICEEFLTRFPRSKYAQSIQEYLVQGYMAADDYEGALRSINALKKQSDAVLDAKQRVHFVLGTRKLAAGDVDGALANLREADKLASRNAETARQNTLWLGDALYAAGDYSGAEKQYRSYIARAPKNDKNLPTATYNLGYALFGSRHYSDARDRLQIAAASASLGDAIRADAYNRIADTYYYESDFTKALTNYRKAREVHPATGDYSMLQEAMMEGMIGDKKAKISTIDQMVAAYPHSSLAAGAITEKALTLASMGRTADAIAAYEQVIQAYPSTAQGRNAMLQLAILNLNAGHRAEAVDFYKRVVTTYPSSSEAALAVQDMTRIFGEEDRIEELTAFLAGVKGAPQVDSVELNALAAASLLKKANAAVKEQNHSSALALATQLLERYPDSEVAEQALAIRADELYHDGRTEEALADYRALAARASDAQIHHRARMGVLSAASDLGRNGLIIETAREIKSSAAGSNADLPRVNYLLACALHDSGSTSEAMEIWSELAKRPANLYGTRAALSMAEAQKEAGNRKSAVDTVNALIDADPPHSYWMARAFILLSDLIRAEGSDFEADEYLKALRSNYPGTDADIFQMIDQRLSE